MILENTLYVLTQGSYVHLDHDSIVVEAEKKVISRVPLHHLSALIVFGNVGMSPFLIHRMARDGKSVAWMTEWGRFQAKLEGPQRGNVLLRVEQIAAASDPTRRLMIIKNLVAGKIYNQRQVLARGAREALSGEDETVLRHAEQRLRILSKKVQGAVGENQVRGFEGLAARYYFQAFKVLLRKDRELWNFKGRNRRPPRDPVNAMLSFGYALLFTECAGACELAGLDPYVGFLHRLRPGRRSLALDIMEEFRPHLVDRVVLSLINRGQIGPKDFHERVGGAVELKDRERKTFIAAFQKRKQEEIQHELLGQQVSVGLLPHYQARILSRYIRKDTNTYLPFLFR